MENYGVVGVNRYALFLDDESDPLDAIKAQEQAKELRKKSKEAEKENKGKPDSKPKAAAAPGTGPRKGIKETQNVKSSENRGESKGKPASGTARTERAPADQRPSGGDQRPPPRRREREDRPNGTVEGRDGPRPPRRDFGERKPYERRNFDGPEGGERRGPRVPRDGPREPRDGPRGPRQYDGRGKREFDRRSGSEKTGVKPVDKRDGGGAHNWGNHKDDLDELNKTVSDGDQTEEKAEAGGGDGQQAPAPVEPAPPVEEEPRELTLDEYKALKTANRQKPQFNLRKANEGADENQWKNLVVLEKKKEDEPDDSDDEFDMADYPQRVGRQKKFLGIEFTFNDTARRGGGGPGRGRGRGRGAPRGRGGLGSGRDEAPVEERRQPQRHAAPPPKVDDNKDFPSLG